MAPPLFLLAPPRSYTSVINAMIGQHPQTFGLPELNLFNVEHLKDLWRRKPTDNVTQPKRRNGLLRAVAEIYGGEQTAATVLMANHWAAARQERSSGEVYRELADKLDPLIIVEKSPLYSLSLRYMRRILETFPDARFIHLVRHPVAQCKSVMKLNDGIFALWVNALEFQEDRAIIEPQIAWYNINITIMNFLDMVPEKNKMRLQGEKLMEQPVRYLRRICQWLEIRDDDKAIDEMMHPERSPFACFGPINALYGNDPNFLRGPSFRQHKPKPPPLEGPLPWRDDGGQLYKEVAELARSFGYS
ncbi:sulfotransferase family protein [Desulfolithobacter sp.]